jgi:hypothetical protein
MAHDLSKLERQIETLDRRITELASLKMTKELVPIIHGPGWTTIAEVALVENAVESLTHSVEHHIQSTKRLLEAAKQVGPAEKITTAA